MTLDELKAEVTALGAERDDLVKRHRTITDMGLGKSASGKVLKRKLAAVYARLKPLEKELKERTA